MLTNNIKTVRNDMKTLVKDAQELFRKPRSRPAREPKSCATRAW